MALTTLNLSIGLSFSADYTELILQDTTGNYNAISNPYGYGSPNGIAVNDVTGLVVALNYTTLGVSVVYTFTVSSGTITAATINFNAGGAVNILSQLVSTTFPFTSSNPFTFFLSYVDSPDTIALPQLEDGAYDVTYRITGSALDGVTPTAFDLTTSDMILQKFTSQCCIDRLYDDARVDNCGCEGDKTYKAITAQTYINIAQYAVDVDDSTKANDFVNRAKTICDCNCGCK